MKSDRLRVAVVGAGMGGLSAAAHLVRAGCEVTVFEASSEVGGKAGFVSREGFVFDTGPTLLTMPDVVRRAFEAAGGDLDRDVGTMPIAPLTRYFFAPRRPTEGPRAVDVELDLERTRRNIERVFPGEGAGYARFLAHAARVWGFAGTPFLEAPFDGVADLAKRILSRGLAGLRDGASLGTLEGEARKHFATDEMRALALRFATYVGADPARASGAFAMIAHLELTEGAVHPRGGMGAIPRALARRLRERGVRIRTGAPVREVVTERGRDGRPIVRGVRIDGEGVAPFDAVVFNVDPQTAYERMVSSEVARRAPLASLRDRELSLSGYALLLGVDGPVAPLAHHTIYFPTDYAAEFRAVFGGARVPDEPTVYVCAPSLTEPGRAPDGSHALFVLVNAPPTGADAAAWSGDTCAAIDRVVLRRLDEIVPGLSSRVRVRERVTPRDIAALGSPGGAIYGQAPHGAMAPFQRPRQRCPVIEGAYFVGGSVNPGGGIPLVTLGGEHAATLLVADRGALIAKRPAASISLAS